MTPKIKELFHEYNEFVRQLTEVNKYRDIIKQQIESKHRELMHEMGIAIKADD